MACAALGQAQVWVIQNPLSWGAPHPRLPKQPPNSLPVAEGHPGQLLSAEQGCCWKLKRESFGLDKGPISQGTRGSQDLKALDTGVQPLYFYISWREWEGATPQEDVDNLPVVLGEAEKQQRVQQLESELSKKRKKCESLEQEARKKQRRCEELELQLREAQNQNARLVEENSRLSGRATEKEQVEWENAELRGQLLGVTQERDSALRKSQGLQSKLESLEQVLKHMREVAQRRQQLEVEHEQARLSLREKQEEVRRLQQAQAEAKREHEGAVQLLEVGPLEVDPVPPSWEEGREVPDRAGMDYGGGEMGCRRDSYMLHGLGEFRPPLA
ncbi:hypothetical protein P7K49_011044 [Saguinus oedipus]|uniref:Uncharacterized protein n=1 Tax=Saguinus oedipus TaxID=9490 RepID=A0ABQ9VPK2_SAGOE|nr:hypothetical protein P7K49_011044 [Saguinus oedipus]